MNKHASALGKLAKGIPKNFSHEEMDKRKRRLSVARDIKAMRRSGEMAEDELKFAESLWKLCDDMGLGASMGDCIRAAKVADAAQRKISRIMRALAVVSHAVETQGEAKESVRQSPQA